MNIKLIETRPITKQPAAGNGYTATDDLWPTNRVAAAAPQGYTATDDLWK